MIVFGYRFEPKLWSIIITLLAIIVFVNLGQWQLSRADEKESAFEQIEKYAKEPAVALPGTLIKFSDFQNRDVEVSGEFLIDKTIYLDNKTYKGLAGYHIVTPLKMANSTMVVAINRGWVRGNADRSILPVVTHKEGLVKITGRVMSPDSKALSLSNQVESGNVWGNFDLQRFAALIDLEVQPIMVLQKDAFDDGLIRDWNRPESGAAKNFGYAVQWFSLAITTAIIFIILNVKREFTKSK